MNNDSHDMEKKIAVALGYDGNDEAPKIIASGEGHLAEKIMNKAKTTGIPQYQDKPLANTLSNLNIGSSIPPELYEIVADILLFVDKVDCIKGKMGESHE